MAGILQAYRTGFTLPRRLDQVVLAHDVVAVEHRPRPVAVIFTATRSGALALTRLRTAVHRRSCRSITVSGRCW